MNWLSDDCVIDLDLLKGREYPYFDGVFEEEVDVAFLHTVLNDKTMVTEYKFVDIENEDGEIVTSRVEKYRDGILQQHPLYPVTQKNEVKKILKNVRNNKNLVSYSGRSKDRTNIGRRFANYCGTNDDGTPKIVYEGQHPNPSLTTVTKSIRNSLFHKLGLTDFDFSASHFTICSEIGKRLRISTPRINDWVSDKDPIVAMLSEHHSVEGHEPLDKGDIKKLIASALFGGGLDTWAYGRKNPDGTRRNGGISNGDADWGVFPKSVKNTGSWRDEHKWYRDLKKEVKMLKETLWSKNREFANAVVPDTKEGEFAQQGSFFSYFLGAIENECLHIAQKYMVENKMMERNTCSLAYDGFTGKLNEGFEASVVAAECSNLIEEHTGFPMKLIDKPIEEKIQYETLDRCEKLGDASIRPLVEDSSWVSEYKTTLKSLPNPPAAGNTFSDIPEMPSLNRKHSTPPKKKITIGEYLKSIKKSKYAAHDDPVYKDWKREFEYGDLTDEKHLFIKQLSSYIYLTHDDYGNVKLMEKNKAELRAMYEDNWDDVVVGKDKKGNDVVKRMDLLELWFKDPEKRSYTRMTSLPHGTRVCKDDTYNSYIPSRFYKKEIPKDQCNIYGDPRWNERAVNAFLNHVKLMCNREDEPADFLLKWIASFIQNPQRKAAHLVITGQTGIGKNSLTEVLKELVGGNTLETTDPSRDCWGTFNILMAGANLVIFNEISQKDSFNAEGKIKGLVTDRKLTINAKGSNQFQIESFHRFITLSNKDEPYKTSKQDRRNMITEMSPELRENDNYWAYWYDKEVGIMSENALLSIYSYLWHYELGDFNPLPPPNKIPLTKHHKELLAYKTPLERFLLHFVTKMLRTKQYILEMNEIDRYRNPTKVIFDTMEAQERKGYISLTGTEFWNEFEMWRKEGNGNKCEVTNLQSLSQRIKNEVIRDSMGGTVDRNAYKEKYCPSQRKKNTESEETYWNIYGMRDYYIQQGDFIPDGNTIVLGESHPSLQEEADSPVVASYNPPVAGEGIENMSELGEALEDASNETYVPEYEYYTESTPTGKKEIKFEVDTTPPTNSVITPTYGGMSYNEETGEMN